MTSQSPKTTRDVALHWWASNPDASAADVADHLNGEGRSLMPTGARALKPATLRQWKARHGLPDVVGGQGMAAPTPAPPPQPPMRPPVPAGDPPPLPRQQPPPAEASAAVWVLLGSIHPWQDNPRDNDAAAIRIAASIARFGYGRAFVAWRESGERMLVVGHTARKATLMLLDAPPVFEFQTTAGICNDCGAGLSDTHDAGCSAAEIPGVPSRGMVPVRWRDDWTEAEARAYAIADNKLGELSDWDSAELALQLRDLDEDHDIAAELLGVDDDELAELMAMLEGEGGEGDGEGDGDGESDKREVLSERGMVYRLGPHVLFCGDSMAQESWDAVLDGCSAHAVVTSPPYGVGIDYGDHVDTIETIRKILNESPDVWMENVVPGGFAAVNFGDIVSGREIAGADEPCEYPMALEYWPRFRGAGWLLWSRRAWCKPNPRCAAPWTASSNRAAADWENVWTWKSPGTAIVSRKDSSNLGWVDTTSMPGVDVGKDVHGAGMPLGAAAWLVRIHTEDGMVVVDPFGGTGTTLIACAESGRLARLIELDPRHCDTIRRRWHSWCVEHGTNPGPDALAPAES